MPLKKVKRDEAVAIADILCYGLRHYARDIFFAYLMYLGDLTEFFSRYNDIHQRYDLFQEIIDWWNYENPYDKWTVKIYAYEKLDYEVWTDKRLEQYAHNQYYIMNCLGHKYPKLSKDILYELSYGLYINGEIWKLSEITMYKTNEEVTRLMETVPEHLKEKTPEDTAKETEQIKEATEKTKDDLTAKIEEVVKATMEKTLNQLLENKSIVNTQVTTAESNVWNIGQSAKLYLAEMLATLIRTVQQMIDRVKQVTFQHVSDIISFVKDAYINTTKAIDKMITETRGFINRVATGMRLAVTTMTTYITKVIGRLVDEIKKKLTVLLMHMYELVDILRNVLSDIADTIKAIYNSIKEMLELDPKKATDYIQTFINTFYKGMVMS
jgi:hypothetical protein